MKRTTKIRVVKKSGYEVWRRRQSGWLAGGFGTDILVLRLCNSGLHSRFHSHSTQIVWKYFTTFQSFTELCYMFMSSSPFVSLFPVFQLTSFTGLHIGFVHQIFWKPFTTFQSFILFVLYDLRAPSSFVPLFPAFQITSLLGCMMDSIHNIPRLFENTSQLFSHSLGCGIRPTSSQFICFSFFCSSTYQLYFPFLSALRVPSSSHHNRQESQQETSKGHCVVTGFFKLLFKSKAII